MPDAINPKHYKNHPSGVECIVIIEHMNFCLGNAMKYIWRADEKGGVEDLQKAMWYLQREIRRRTQPSKIVMDEPPEFAYTNENYDPAPELTYSDDEYYNDPD